MPEVSVVIPAYNCGRYISDGIDSVINQTSGDCEIIVVDGSTDNTKQLLESYIQRGQVKYVFQKPCGVSAARNLGIQLAESEWIAFQDADDLWAPEKLALQMAALRRYPEAALVFTDTLTFDESGVIGQSVCHNMLKDWFAENQVSDTHLACGRIYRELLLGNCIPTSSVVIKKQVLTSVGGFDERFKECGEDYDLWLRVGRQYPVIFVNQVLQKYRVREDGLSGNAIVRSLRWEHANIEVREQHLKNNLLPKNLDRLVRELLSQRCWDVGWHYFNANRLKEARSLLFRSARYRPWHIQTWIFGAVCFLPKSILKPVRQGVRWCKNLKVSRLKRGLPQMIQLLFNR